MGEQAAGRAPGRKKRREGGTAVSEGPRAENGVSSFPCSVAQICQPGLFLDPFMGNFQFRPGPLTRGRYSLPSVKSMSLLFRTEKVFVFLFLVTVVKVLLWLGWMWNKPWKWGSCLMLFRGQGDLLPGPSACRGSCSGGSRRILPWLSSAGLHGLSAALGRRFISQ